MNIYGEKVVLRAMEPEDMEMLRSTVNDPGIERMVGGWSFPVSRSEQMAWYERAVTDKRNLRFIIERLDNNEAIGMVNLVEIDWKNRSAFHGVKLKTNAPKRQGYALDAVMTLMKYTFEELQLVRLDGSWIEYNTASIKLYEKCGWIIEGTKEKAVFTNGQYYRVHFGGVLAENYFEAKRRLGWVPHDTSE